jgi:hemophore-related protein
MVKLSAAKPIVVAGGLALSLAMGAGIASAQPDLSPIINSTCTYPQVVAALNAQAPDLAQKLNQYPFVQRYLQRFVASSPDQRQQMVNQLTSNTNWMNQANAQGGTQLNQALFLQIANTCNQY